MFNGDTPISTHFYFGLLSFIGNCNYTVDRQQISWSQGHSTSLYISKSILWIFNPSMNYAWYKDKLWIRKVTTEVEVVIIRGNQVVEKTTLLKEIRRNQTREQEVQKELEKDEG